MDAEELKMELLQEVRRDVRELLAVPRQIEALSKRVDDFQTIRAFWVEELEKVMKEHTASIDEKLAAFGDGAEKKLGDFRSTVLKEVEDRLQTQVTAFTAARTATAVTEGEARGRNRILDRLVSWGIPAAISAAAILLGKALAGSSSWF